jgi:hypothetical protein
MDGSSLTCGGKNEKRHELLRGVPDPPLQRRLYARMSRSDRVHFVGLQALLALHHLEAHLLAFLQTLEPIALDGAEMDENVLAILTGNEAKPLGVVEPLDGTNLTIRHETLSQA